MTGRFRLVDGVTLNEIDGKTVLFSMKSGDSFGLNESAAVLLKSLLDSDFDSAVAACAQLFEVTEDVIRPDLTELIEHLTGEGILVPGPDPD